MTTLTSLVHTTAVVAWNDTVDTESEAAALAAAAAAVEDKLIEEFGDENIHQLVNIPALARRALGVEPRVPDPNRRGGAWYSSETYEETHARLWPVIDAVKTGDTWKNPIEATIPVDQFDQGLIFEALAYYGCGPAEFIDNGDGTITVCAAGYYACTGS
jgi:hypothetical protein